MTESISFDEDRPRRAAAARRKVPMAVLALVSLLAAGCSGSAGLRQEQGDRQALEQGSVESRTTEGAPYQPAPPKDRIPNVEEPWEPVPTGPPRGDRRPANPAFEVVVAPLPRPDRGETAPERRGPSPVFFKHYKELTNAVSVTSGCCPEVSVAENGKTVMLTGNTWMALSEDGGNNFSIIDPTTIFPEDDGGLCCDQVIVYVPRIDMFVWLLQYLKDDKGRNRIRIAAQTTSQVLAGDGLSWTYWDFPSTFFAPDGDLDYNDVAFGESSFWWTSQIGGRVVVRFPLSELAAMSTLNFQFTKPTDARWSHLTQDATDTVYWAGHLSSSELRVYDLRDGDGFYSWRTVNILSWPNGTNSADCPNGADWMSFEANKHYVFGNAWQNGSVWFAWLASADVVNFPMPHVQMVRIDPGSWTMAEQQQIWSDKIAFQDAYLSTNSLGELGIEVAFGGGGFYPSNSVGVWGDNVLYTPRLSTRCSGRWGDYNHVRRSTENPADWVAAGYSMEMENGKKFNLPHYLRFGR